MWVTRHMPTKSSPVDWMISNLLDSMWGISGFLELMKAHMMSTTGHSSTSISVALGIAKARDLRGEDYSILAVIGDGS